MKLSKILTCNTKKNNNKNYHLGVIFLFTLIFCTKVIYYETVTVTQQFKIKVLRISLHVKMVFWMDGAKH